MTALRNRPALLLLGLAVLIAVVAVTVIASQQSQGPVPTSDGAMVVSSGESAAQIPVAATPRPTLVEARDPFEPVGGSGGTGSTGAPASAPGSTGSTGGSGGTEPPTGTSTPTSTGSSGSSSAPSPSSAPTTTSAAPTSGTSATPSASVKDKVPSSQATASEIPATVPGGSTPTRTSSSGTDKVRLDSVDAELEVARLTINGRTVSMSVGDESGGYLFSGVDTDECIILIYDDIEDYLCVGDEIDVIY